MGILLTELCRQIMAYSELVYFEGAHFAHLALRQETQRLSRLADAEEREVAGRQPRDRRAPHFSANVSCGSPATTNFHVLRSKAVASSFQATRPSIDVLGLISATKEFCAATSTPAEAVMKSSGLYR